jgi:aspartyl protease family protein
MTFRSQAAGGAAALAFALLAGSAAAQTVTYNGSMGDKALLVIDGQLRTVALGGTVQGVKLAGLATEEARIEVNGKPVVLRHGAPVNLAGLGGSRGGGTEIVLSAGPGGHFWADGSINGKSAHFLVDTGATTVAMSTLDAERMGLDYRNGQRMVMSTANGDVPAWRIVLTSVRIGDVEVYTVPATVTPAAMDVVLLGNSFLGRFQMHRDNDTLRLEKRP